MSDVELPPVLPEMTDAVLDQWEQAANTDLLDGAVFQAHPAAVIALVRELRGLRAAKQANEDQPQSVNEDSDPQPEHAATPTEPEDEPSSS